MAYEDRSGKYPYAHRASARAEARVRLAEQAHYFAGPRRPEPVSAMPPGWDRASSVIIADDVDGGRFEAVIVSPAP
ncbi:hypothetical protein ACIRSS_42240 [Amycolatopsis sp. NPDC101161]|uniref:hypothetical protein n=1 Tax=Amycolatopsis sp. NPDC101161 TaxID=3363940 RepID=UPI0038205FDA